jgi:pimeloyl-ACP methyl ester carboxylesterase
VPQPVLIAVAESGSADDEVSGERMAALDDVLRMRAAQGLGAPQVRRFAGAGHNVMRYRPDQLSEALVELLEGLAHQRS